ncbi:MAG: AraC family transcriptional regulator [Thermoflexibacter sp.]|jgi:AraC-like DNA-binding protein|nr:AraC family transcriptional regulator [Thermoflexibacter sp.]
MKLLQFNLTQGLYAFELEHLEATWHAHPAFEVILALEGHFELTLANQQAQQATFAIVPKNITHRVITHSKTLFMLVEHHDTFMEKTCQQYQINSSQGFFANENQDYFPRVFGILYEQILNQNQRMVYESRVQRCLEIFDNQIFNYQTMMTELKNQVHLSDSRLSHLFKGELGISLKKYLLWNRLKQTIHLFLTQNENLFSASLTAGFYDQSHLTKAFKEMFGINPSLVYNSRILQNI